MSIAELRIRSSATPTVQFTVGQVVTLASQKDAPNVRPYISPWFSGDYISVLCDYFIYCRSLGCGCGGLFRILLVLLGFGL